ncbi:MAG: YggT family protein [Anaerolineales bacterium]|nr:YggT family protein [Anaerolineales bacterium]
MIVIVQILNTILQVFTWVILIHVLLSWFLPPDHSIRFSLSRVVEPFLKPIRDLIPPLGMFDFSPVILLILLQLLQQLIVRILL